jgi:hypothetical protein
MDVNKLPVMPSITGNPLIDTLIRSALIAVATAIGAVIVTWLNAHGFNDPNLGTMVTGAILSVLAVIAVGAWGYINAKLTRQRVVATTAVAAATGVIPTPVVAITKPADEAAITAALNKAQLSKGASP